MLYILKFYLICDRKLIISLSTGVPRLTEDTPDTEIAEVRRAASLFSLPYLTTICDNLEQEQDFLNPSIGTFLNDETSAQIKKLFFNKPLLADVVFLLGSKIVV